MVMSKTYKRYTDKQIEFLKNNVKGRTLKELTDYFNNTFNDNRSQAAIKGVLIRFNLKRGKLYTEEMLNYIRSLVDTHTTKEITDMFNKKFKTNRSFRSMCSARSRYGIKNKKRPGKRGFGIGHETLDSGGYVRVKVSDNPVKWRHKHMLLWEKHNRPLKDDEEVIFLDQDKTNITIDNLRMVNNRVGGILKTNNLSSTNPQETETGILLAELMLKTNDIDYRDNDYQKWHTVAHDNGISPETFIARVKRGASPKIAATVPINQFDSKIHTKGDKAHV